MLWIQCFHFCLQFQIVSNTVRMHALETSFSFFCFGLICVWRVCITLKRNVCFFILANTAQYILVFFKVCFKMSQKCSCGDIGCQIFRGSMSPDPSRPMMPTHWFIPSYVPDKYNKLYLFIYMVEYILIMFANMFMLTDCINLLS